MLGLGLKLWNNRRGSSGSGPNVNARPGSGVLSLAGYAPTVTGTAFTEATPGVGAISLVGYAPTASAVVNVATLTINSIGPQQSDGDVPTDYTIDQNDSGVEGLLRLSTTAAPDAADFGADSGGGADAGGYTDLGTVNLTVGGSAIDMPLPDGLDGSYIIDLLPTGGGDSDVASSAAVTIDTTAPAYASSTPADEGTDIAIDTTIAITFDEAIAAGTGTFVLYDVTGAATVETFTVGGAGDNGGTISISTPTVTLTPGANLSNSNAYSVRWTAGAITDAFSNPVAANSGDTLLNFTTVAAASGPTVTLVANPAALAGGGSGPFTFTSVDLSAAAEGDQLYILAMLSDFQGDVTFSGCTVGGVSATAVIESGSTSTNASCAIYRIARGASSTANIVLSATSAFSPAFTKIIVYSVPGYDTTYGTPQALNNDSAKSFTVDTTTDCVVFACSAAQFFDPGLSGVSNILNDTSGGRFWSAGYAIATVAEARAIATTEGDNSCLVAAVFTQGA